MWGNVRRVNVPGCISSDGRLSLTGPAHDSESQTRRLYQRLKLMEGGTINVGVGVKRN